VTHAWPVVQSLSVEHGLAAEQSGGRAQCLLPSVSVKQVHPTGQQFWVPSEAVQGSRPCAQPQVGAGPLVARQIWLSVQHWPPQSGELFVSHRQVIAPFTRAQCVPSGQHLPLEHGGFRLVVHRQHGAPGGTGQYLAKSGARSLQNSLSGQQIGLPLASVPHGGRLSVLQTHCKAPVVGFCWQCVPRGQHPFGAPVAPGHGTPLFELQMQRPTLAAPPKQCCPGGQQPGPGHGTQFGGHVQRQSALQTAGGGQQHGFPLQYTGGVSGGLMFGHTQAPDAWSQTVPAGQQQLPHGA
jgi:hypothetical protein